MDQTSVVETVVILRMHTTLVVQLSAIHCEAAKMQKKTEGHGKKRFLVDDDDDDDDDEIVDSSASLSEPDEDDIKAMRMERITSALQRWSCEKERVQSLELEILEAQQLESQLQEASQVYEAMRGDKEKAWDKIKRARLGCDTDANHWYQSTVSASRVCQTLIDKIQKTTSLDRLQQQLLDAARDLAVASDELTLAKTCTDVDDYIEYIAKE
jgi:hypothetical protein